MTTSIKAVAWDIDGTLIDSEPLHDKVLAATCVACGIDDIDDFMKSHFRGQHLEDVFLRVAPRLSSRITLDEWRALMVENYVAQSHTLPRWQAAFDIVKALSEQGIRQVCVSNSGRSVVNANLAVIGIDDMIEFSISIDDVTKGKPDPEPYALAAEKLGLDASLIAAVEDSATGARSAHLAGMQVFGIKSTGVDIPLAIKSVDHHAELLPLLIPSHDASSSAKRKRTHG